MCAVYVPPLLFSVIFVSYGLSPRDNYKNIVLFFQLWDRDLFKFNDHIAEGLLDLGPYFIRAYKTRETVKLFPTIDPKMEEMRKADVSKQASISRTFRDSVG